MRRLIWIEARSRMWLVVVIVLGVAGGASRTASAQRWTSLGGTSIERLWINPHDPNIVYASMREGVFEYTHGTWSSVIRHGWSLLAHDPKDQNTIYGIGESGVVKSTDGGKSWAYILSNGELNVEALAIDPQNPSVLYAGTATSSEGPWWPTPTVFKSTDGGHTWSSATSWDGENSNRVCPGWNNISALAIDPLNPSTVYATTSDCNDQGGFLWKSTDGGATWHNTKLNVGWAGSLAIDPQNPETLYAGAHAHGVAKSTDGGTTWEKLRSLPAFFPVTSLVINPQNPSTLYAASSVIRDDNPGGVFKSTDGGATWSPFSDGLSNMTVLSLAIAPRGPETLYAGTAGGLFRMIAATPVLSLNSAQYCIGDSWTLKVINGVPNTGARLVGTSNGKSWEITEWRETDADGTFSEEGKFAVEAVGSHTLRLDIGGNVSNTISFVVSDCRPNGRIAFVLLDFAGRRLSFSIQCKPK